MKHIHKHLSHMHYCFDTLGKAMAWDRKTVSPERQTHSARKEGHLKAKARTRTGWTQSPTLARSLGPLQSESKHLWSIISGWITLNLSITGSACWRNHSSSDYLKVSFFLEKIPNSHGLSIKPDWPLSLAENASDSVSTWKQSSRHAFFSISGSGYCLRKGKLT